MKCDCGFEFAGPGEFRNCAAFITENGNGGVICPTCGNSYVDGCKVTIVFPKETQDTKKKKP